MVEPKRSASKSRLSRKKAEKPREQSGNLARVSARPKLTASRETRLLALLTFGESFEASCRAINVSSTAIRKRASRDPAFAERLRAARENRVPALVPVEDWRVVAARLEREYPEHWKLPEGDPFDAFEFDPQA
jgi:hypothetical protein